MANYNCTQLGCVSALTGTYSTLQSCQSACVGWGCPPQLTTNTNITANPSPNAVFTVFDTAKYEHIPKKNVNTMLSTNAALINNFNNSIISYFL